jgi:hypothetical protein
MGHEATHLCHTKEAAFVGKSSQVCVGRVATMFEQGLATTM